MISIVAQLLLTTLIDTTIYNKCNLLSLELDFVLHMGYNSSIIYNRIIKTIQMLLKEFKEGVLYGDKQTERICCEF